MLGIFCQSGELKILEKNMEFYFAEINAEEFCLLCGNFVSIFVLVIGLECSWFKQYLFRDN